MNALKPLYQSDEIENNRKLLFYFCAITGVFSVFYCLIAYVISFDILMYAAFLDAFCFLLLAYLTKSKVPSIVVAFLYLLFFFVTTVVLSYFSGGLYSPVLPWLLIIPLMSMLLRNVKNGLFWGVLCVLTFILFGLLQSSGKTVALGYNPEFKTFYTALCLIGLLCIMTYLTFLFTKIKNKAMDKLSTNIIEVKEINQLYDEQTKEMISQNEELRQQQEEILAQREYIEDQNDILKATLEELTRQNKNIEKQKKVFENKNLFIEKFNRVLLNLTKSHNIQNGNFSISLEEITALSSNILNATRVSVWTFRRESQDILCEKLYNKDEHEYKDGLVLSKKNIPKFLAEAKKLSVMKVFKSDDTKLSKEVFSIQLQPESVQSILFIPFVFNNELGGIIAFEVEDAKRDWSPEEIAFAVAIGDIVNLAYSMYLRKISEEKIIEQKEEIEAINASLEKRVEERTKALNEQNEKLAEYAFINSHLLRGPLCRIIGLIYLLKIDNDKDLPEILQHMTEATNELDDVVDHINRALDEGNHFSREDFGKQNYQFVQGTK